MCNCPNLAFFTKSLQIALNETNHPMFHGMAPNRPQFCQFDEIMTSCLKSLQITVNHHNLPHAAQSTSNHYKSLQVTTVQCKSPRITTNCFAPHNLPPITTNRFSYYGSLRFSTSRLESLQIAPKPRWLRWTTTSRLISTQTASSHYQLPRIAYEFYLHLQPLKHLYQCGRVSKTRHPPSGPCGKFPPEPQIILYVPACH